MGLSFGLALRGDIRKDFDERVRKLNFAHETALRRWGLDLKTRLRAQLAGVTSSGRTRGRGQNIGKTWTDRFYKNKGTDPASLVYSGAPNIISLFSEGGTVHPRQAKMLVIALPGAVALGLDRIYGDRGGGARLRKASDLASALATLGTLHRIARRDGSVVLAIELKRFRAAGGKGRFGRRRGQLVPLFLLVRSLSFRRKIDPDSIARNHVERLPDYINAALDERGFD